MNHAFLDCSQHPPRRRVAVVCAVRSDSVMLAKPDSLSVVVTAAQRELQMTRHFRINSRLLFDRRVL